MQRDARLLEQVDCRARADDAVASGDAQRAGTVSVNVAVLSMVVQGALVACLLVLAVLASSVTAAPIMGEVMELPEGERASLGCLFASTDD